MSQVPDEAAVLVRALLAADKNQKFARARMSEKDRMNTPEIDYRPFIIADTGHGGEVHVGARQGNQRGESSGRGHR